MSERPDEHAAGLKRHALRAGADRHRSRASHEGDDAGTPSQVEMDLELRQRAIDVLMAENNRLVDQLRTALRQIRVLERSLLTMKNDRDRQDTETVAQ